jgi:HB1, ASXL, restriction endonuclease HTH domain
MSKKKGTTKKKATTTTDADPPVVLPMTKGGAAKKKGKAQPAAPPPVAPDMTPPADAEQAMSPATAETPPTETADASAATPTPPANAARGKKQGTAKETTPKKMSCLDAAAKVLADAGTAMTTGEMIEAMGKANLWSSPNGRTPSATLYSSVLREINTKGTDARFVKTERGKFAAKR